MSDTDRVGWDRTQDVQVHLCLEVEYGLDEIRSGSHRVLGWCAGCGSWSKPGTLGIAHRPVVIFVEVLVLNVPRVGGGGKLCELSLFM